MVQSGKALAVRRDTLHNRLQLRALPPPEKEMTIMPFRNPCVEELN
jgi:hypothetical protein